MRWEQWPQMELAKKDNQLQKRAYYVIVWDTTS